MERVTNEVQRQSETTALPRATIYSLFSQLLSSPHELKPLSLTSDISFEGLPFDFNVLKSKGKPSKDISEVKLSGFNS